MTTQSNRIEKMNATNHDIKDLTTISHTAGPWETGSGACHMVYGPKSGGRQRKVASCCTQDGSIEYHYEETFCNAKLIAAAPDLLQACHDALDHLRNPWSDGKGRSDRIEQLQAVIAKAKGLRK